LIKGPRLESRVVAFDLLTIIGIGLIATYSVVTGRTVFLDIAIVLALISFLGTIAFASYLERQR
jgi:multicomponent Na+:H+ antiporter subunit F